MGLFNHENLQISYCKDIRKPADLAKDLARYYEYKRLNVYLRDDYNPYS